jgi:glycosyltransferase involved in cell wall biosynthesis
MELTVILPVYNAAKYLQACLDSLLMQEFNNFKLIVVNDGSTDDSLSILNKELNRFHCAQLISQENSGLTISLNKAIKLADSRFIARMDSDDISHPLRFIKQIDYLKNAQVDICSSNAFFFSNNNVNYKRILPNSHNKLISYGLFKSPLIHPGVMLNYSKISYDFIYNDDLNGIEDHMLWLELFAKGYKFGNISDYLIMYRIHNDSVTYQSQINALSERYSLVLRMYELFLEAIGYGCDIEHDSRILAILSSKHFFLRESKDDFNSIDLNRIADNILACQLFHGNIYLRGLLNERFFLYSLINRRLNSSILLHSFNPVKEFLYKKFLKSIY